MIPPPEQNEHLEDPVVHSKPGSIDEIDDVGMAPQYPHDINLLFDVSRHRPARDGDSLEEMVHRA